MKNKVLSISAPLLVPTDTENTASLRTRLTVGASGTLVFKVIGLGLSFLINILIARVLGTTGYGAYTYATAWVNFLGVPAAMGLESLLVREMASYRAQSAWGLMRGLLRWANGVVLLSAAALVLIVLVLARFFSGTLDEQVLILLPVALALLPIEAQTGLRQSALQGLSHVLEGQLPETLIRPALIIVAVGIAYLLLGPALTIVHVITLVLLADAVAYGVGAYLLHRALPQTVKEAAPLYRGREWMGSALPLLFFASIQIIHRQADVLILGALKGTEAVAIYSAANHLARTMLIVLGAVNTPLAPVIAGLYAKGEMQRLQAVVTKSAFVLSAFGVSALLVLLLCGHYLLLPFGPAFARGTTALAILSVGQFVNVAMGSVGILLIMTKHERYAAIGSVVATALNVFLNLALVPRWGVEGAAMATASSVIVWNLIQAFWVYKKLGIRTTILAGLR